ncbi:hypothetical protein LAZ67_16000353 [Cordylochernes scorpioides]|uniref:Integrase catalytic domain-containing protein n=1 Tax=Cordylochernes scorpioides TaxID=51811 RepID=A0ABY6LD78_9ARAC|nr:hypothetical protein LAZ67_16000353 [Cordylochernes scorpioides]
MKRALRSRAVRRTTISKLIKSMEAELDGEAPSEKFVRINYRIMEEYMVKIREEDELIWKLMLEDKENDDKVLEEERDTVIHYYEKWIDLEIKTNHFLSSLMKDTEALHGASSKKGSLPGTGVCRLPKLDLKICDGSSLEFGMSEKPRVVGVTLMKGVDPASIKEDAGIVVSSEQMVEETSKQIAVEESIKAQVVKGHFAEDGEKAQVDKRSVVEVDESHRAEVKKESVEADEEKGLDVEQGMDSKNTEEVKLLYAEQGTDSKVAERQDADLENGKDSEAEAKDIGVGDSETAIKGYESVSNSKAVAEGADQVEISDGEAESIDDIEERVVRVPASRKLVEAGQTGDAEFKVTGYYLPDRPVFGCESKTTPIRPVFDDASCRGRNGFSLKRHLRRRPSLLRGIPEIRIKLRENKFGVLADLKRYFRLMLSARYLKILKKRKWLNDDAKVGESKTLSKQGCTIRITYVNRETIEKGSIGKYLPNNKMQLVSKETVSGAVVTPILYTPASSPKGQVPTPEKNLNLGDKSPERSGKSAKLERIANPIDHRNIILSGLRSLKKISESYDCSGPSDDTSKPSDDTSKPADDALASDPDSSKGKAQGSQEVPEVAVEDSDERSAIEDSQPSEPLDVEGSGVGASSDVEVRAQTKSPKAISSKILCMKKEESSIDLEEEDNGRNEPSPASITIKALEPTDSKEIDQIIVMLPRNKVTNSLEKTSATTTSEMLSFIAKLEDPLRWLAPVLVTEKNNGSKVVDSGLHWDDPMDETAQGVKLHGFGDDSEDAYAAAVYIRIPTDDGVSVRLLASKTKLAPMRKMSIPRLELCAALLLTRLVKYNGRVEYQTGECYLLVRFYHSLELVAWILRFCHNCRYSAERYQSHLTTAELRNAHRRILQSIQFQHFREEIRSLTTLGSVKRTSKIYGLTPFLDDQGILRVGGRLKWAPSMTYERKHSALLPSSGKVAQMIVRAVHMRTMHGSVHLMLSTWGQKYWMLRVKDKVKRCIRECVTFCRYNRVTQGQLMSDLPKERLTPGKPFSISGVDYAGPVNLRMSKGRGRKTEKGYICLFVCFVTRAVHLELVTDASTPTFMSAFKRFVARRGHCTRLYSDQGTGFVGAARQLRSRFYLAQNQLKELAAVLANDGNLLVRARRARFILGQDLGADYTSGQKSVEMENLMESSLGEEAPTMNLFGPWKGYDTSEQLCVVGITIGVNYALHVQRIDIWWPDVVNNPAPDRWRDFTGTNQDSPPYAGSQYKRAQKWDKCGNPITHPRPRLPSTFHIGITTEPVKVDRITEDSSMQRMTEVGDEYVADALTNMQPHYEDLVGRLTDAIRGLAVPRAEEALISSFDGSHATSSLLPNSHLQRSTPASISHFKMNKYIFLFLAISAILAFSAAVVQGVEMENLMESSLGEEAPTMNLFGPWKGYDTSEFEDEDLEALLEMKTTLKHKNSLLAASLNITRQAVSLGLHVMGKIQKEGKWLRHELSKRTKNIEERYLKSYWKGFKENRWRLYLTSILTGEATHVSLEQLTQFCQEIAVKRPECAQIHGKLMLLHDNARPHIGK